MDKQHTFQVGDRVIGFHRLRDEYSFSLTKEATGYIEKVIGGDSARVVFDNPNLNRSDGVWYIEFPNLKHDTNFQVGDWVRYDPIDDCFGIEEYAGEVGQVDKMSVNQLHVKLPKHRGGAWYAKNNFVKITKPQKENKEMLPEFTHASHVKLTVKGSELTSSSVQEGDKGVVKDHKYASDGWQPKYKYRVVFQTKNGPRSQWVWENHLAHSAEDPMLKKLEEKVKELGEKSDKLYAEWSDVVSILAEARDQLEKYKDLLKWVGGK